MKRHLILPWSLLAASLMMTGLSPLSVSASSPPQKSATSKSKAKKKAAAKTSARKKGASSGGKANARPRTSEEARRRQEATQREIRLTEQQIKENDRSIKAGLNELGKLETDILASRKVIKTTSEQIKTLTGQIDALESGIAGNEEVLKRLREEYLRAVKKMRVSRKNRSDLTFIFASESFNQALRRMRYLKQFSDWKDRQTEAIGGKTEELKRQKAELTEARTRHDDALRLQKAEEASLVSRYARQDAIVADLKKNGAALKTHLSKKQAEADQLRNQIAALIAEEERKAAEERERKEREQRLAREREEQREREAEEARRTEIAAAKEEIPGDAAKEEKPVVAAKGKAKGDAKGNAKGDAKGDGGKKYADARKRRPRSQASGQTEGSGTAASAAKPDKGVGSNFGSMKGSLPKPASGAFKVTSRFGRQSLPDLPDVVYENPGIDAEVAAGASALAVYEGKVSGVYMLPGYNTVVIVNHGNYYTVYGNIASPSVRIGDEVRAGQGLGPLATDEDDSSRSSIHFEVWRSREKLNPLEWIRI